MQLNDEQKRNDNNTKPRTRKEIRLQPSITIIRNLTFPWKEYPGHV